MADVPAERRYLALGAMVTVTRGLEHEAYLVARALGVLDPEKLNITPALRKARRQARTGLPPWSRDLSLEQVEQWIDTVLPLIEDRNREVHWRRYSRNVDGTWAPYRASLREKREAPEASVEDLERLSQRATAAARAAHEIWVRLLLKIRPGVFHWHPHLGPTESVWTPIVLYTDGEWPSRPTADEIDGWYEELKRTSPPEWASWPDERHEQQRSGGGSKSPALDLK